MKLEREKLCIQTFSRVEMKIYLNRTPVSGPWGGGNKTLSQLVQKLKQKGHDVVFNLTHKDIDVYFCFDPRPNSHGDWYGSIHEHRNNFSGKIIQRVGDVGTHSKPELTELVKQTVSLSDHVIFPSNWAMNHIDVALKNYTIVFNTPLSVFHIHKDGKETLEKNRKVRIVTHHWSDNPKKGFDLYSALDNILPETNYEFTYIGRLPSGFKLKNSNYIKPIDAKNLAKELPRHDIYLTASIEEAGANHVLEAMACGLPVVYHDLGGSIPEYCDPWGGTAFCDFDTMMKSIDNAVSEYNKLKPRVMTYSMYLEKEITRYVDIIENVIK